MTEIVRCFFFNDTATTEIYTLSLHDALPIFGVFTFMTQWTSYLWPLVISTREDMLTLTVGVQSLRSLFTVNWGVLSRSEEHTSELQSRQYRVRPFLFKKKKTTPYYTTLHTPY